MLLKFFDGGTFQRTCPSKNSTQHLHLGLLMPWLNTPSFLTQNSAKKKVFSDTGNLINC